jgi:hypothetical protein
MDKISPSTLSSGDQKRLLPKNYRNLREGWIEGRRNGRREGGKGSFKLDSNVVQTPQLMLLCIGEMPVTCNESSGDCVFSSKERSRSIFFCH